MLCNDKIHPAFKLNLTNGQGDWTKLAGDIQIGYVLSNNSKIITSQIRLINAEGGSDKASEKSAGFTPIGYKMDEIEKELSAQIERAQASGLKISYIDPHMGIALSTPELRALTEKLAHKYKLGISILSKVNYFGETYKEMWGEPIATKKAAFLDYLNTKLDAKRPNLMVLHTATPSPEMDVLVDMNSNMMNSKEGKPLTSIHRQTELNALLSPEFKSMIGKKFKLINYDQLLATKDVSVLKASDN